LSRRVSYQNGRKKKIKIIQNKFNVSGQRYFEKDGKIRLRDRPCFFVKRFKGDENDKNG